MTMQAVGGMFWPDYSQFGRLASGATGFVSFLLDAAGEKFTFVFDVPKAGNLARIGFRTATVTTGDTLKISFQDVDPATGFPDGVADQFRTQAVLDADDNKWFRTGLITSDGSDSGSKRAVTKGAQVAVVIEFNSYVAGALNIASKGSIGLANGPFTALCYLGQFTSSWSLNQVTLMAMVAVEYDDGSFAYIPNSVPIDTEVSPSVSSSTSPDEVALKFRLPFKAKVSGFWAIALITGDTDVVLYDSDGSTPLLARSIDKDVHGTVGNAFAGTFPDEALLEANTYYRLALKPTTTTAITARGITVATDPGAAQLDQMSGGQDCHWSERTDAGSWTAGDNTLKRPLMGLILSGLDDGVSQGGVSRAAVVNAGG